MQKSIYSPVSPHCEKRFGAAAASNDERCSSPTVAECLLGRSRLVYSRAVHVPAQAQESQSQGDVWHAVALNGVEQQAKCSSIVAGYINSPKPYLAVYSGEEKFRA